MAEQEATTTAPVEPAKDETTINVVVPDENTNNIKHEDTTTQIIEEKTIAEGDKIAVPSLNTKMVESEMESKQEMANALTTLISTFRDETIQQEELLSAMEQDALSANANFGDSSRAAQWTKKEVSHWLTLIGLQEYINSFLSASIDGAILLQDITSETLKSDLKVKTLHCNKILREIAKLKGSEASESADAVSDDANLNDIISTIKKENEQLLAALNEQKALNAQLQSNTNSDFHSIPSRRTSPKAVDSENTTPTASPSRDQEIETVTVEVAVPENGKSLKMDIVEKQKQIINELSDQLQQLRVSTDKQIKKLQKKNKQLQDGYIQIETHYQSQLTQSMSKSKDLLARISVMNEQAQSQSDNDTLSNPSTSTNSKPSHPTPTSPFGTSGQIGLLWSENEQTANELRAEKERRILLEASFRDIQLSLNRERQKRKLLESQTSRLTAELTKYLAPSRANGGSSRFSRFKLKSITKSRSYEPDTNNNANHDSKASSSVSGSVSNSNHNTTMNTVEKSDDVQSQINLAAEPPSIGRRQPSMDARAGWIKFLSSAQTMGHNLKASASARISRSDPNSNHQSESNGNTATNNNNTNSNAISTVEESMSSKKVGFRSHIPKQLSLVSLGNKMKNRRPRRTSTSESENGDKSSMTPTTSTGSTSTSGSGSAGASKISNTSPHSVIIHTVEEETESVDDQSTPVLGDTGNEEDPDHDAGHLRKATLGQTVMNTFKKIQNAAQSKMTRKSADDEKGKEDGNDNVDGAMNGDDNRNEEENSVVVRSGSGSPKDEVEDEDDEDIEEELEDSVFDEDSSAEKAEIEFRKSRRRLLEAENARNGMEEGDEEDYDTEDESVVIKRGHLQKEDNYSNAALDLEFAPALAALHQSELDM